MRCRECKKEMAVIKKNGKLQQGLYSCGVPSCRFYQLMMIDLSGEQK